MKTYKEFTFNGKRYRWEMTNWQAVAVGGGIVAMMAVGFAEMTYLLLMM